MRWTSTIPSTLLSLLILSSVAGAPMEAGDEILPVKVVARATANRGPLHLDSPNGDPVGAIQLIERKGREGFLMVTGGDYPQPPQVANLELDSKVTFRLKCVTAKPSGVVMTTCVAKGRGLEEKLAAAMTLELWFGERGSRPQGTYFEVKLSKSELEHFRTHVSRE